MIEKNINTPCDDVYKTVRDIAEILLKRNETVSLAESITGGLIAATFTDIPGSSNWFSSGIVSYSDKIKNSVLKVKSTTLKDFTAVSKECASEMVSGAIRLFDSDYSIAVTGYAGPSGENVGEVYIAVSDKNNNKVVKRYDYNPSLTRVEIRKCVLLDALSLFYSFLTKNSFE